MASYEEYKKQFINQELGNYLIDEELKRRQQEEINNRTVEDWKNIRDEADVKLKQTQSKIGESISDKNAYVSGSSINFASNILEDKPKIGQKMQYTDNPLLKQSEKLATYYDFLGTDEAKQYQSELNQAWDERARAISDYETRKAIEDEQNMSTLSKLVMQPIRGSASMFSWLRGDLATQEGQLPSYNEVIMNQTVQNEDNPLLKLGYQALSEIGKQTTTRAMNAIIPGSGSVAYFGDIANDQYNNAINEGYSHDAAVNFAIISGTSEALLERFLGAGSAYFGKKMGGESVISSLLSKVIKNKTLNDIISSTISEGTEEFLEEYLGEFNRQLTLEWADKDKNIDFSQIFSRETFNNALQSGIVGAITGAYGAGSQRIATPKDTAKINQAMYDLERQGIELNENNKNIIYNLEYIAEQSGIKLTADDIVKNFNIIKESQMETFKKSAVNLFPNLQGDYQKQYNDLVNDVSKFIYDTNTNVKFDPSQQELAVWNGNELTLNPTLTDMPVKTLVLKELGTKQLDSSTKKSIISNVKKNGLYDGLKAQLLQNGFTEQNVDDEIVSRELNNILQDEKQMSELAEKNSKFATTMSNLKGLFANLTSRNTKDSQFFKQLLNNINYAENNLQFKQLKELDIKGKEEIENEFRRIQEESRRIPNEEQQLYRRGEKRVDEKVRGRLSNVFGRILESRSNEYGYGDELHLESKKNGTTFDMYQNVDGKTFHDIFEISRNYLTNGELVDLHSAEDYNETENYMASDGLSGFAITKDGDLISVFNLNDKKGFLYAISDIVKEKAKTLDCYMSEKQPLSEIYEKVFGFKIASVMEYNMEYDHDDIAKNHNMPKVAFMVNTDEEVMTRRFNKDQYDEAYNYRQSYLEEQKPAESSNKVVEGNDLYNELNENKQIIRTTNNLLSLLNKEVTPRYGMSTQLQNKGKNQAMYGQQTIKFKPEILNYVDKMYKGDGATNRGGTRAENPNQFNTIEESMADNSKIYNEMLIKGNVPIADMIEEVRIPDNSSDELINKLKDLGIKYTTYKPAPSYNQTKEVKTEEKGTAQRKTYTSIMESPNQSEKAKEIAREKMGTDTYVPDSNEKELKRADEYIEKYGVDKSLETLKQNTESTRNNVDDVVIGERLMQYFAKTGEADKLDEAIQLTAMAGTNVGRAVQAMAMINRQTPEGQATWIQRSVDKMNKQMQEAYDKSKNPFKKLQQFDFTAEMKQKIINSTKENLEDNLNEVYAELGKQVKMSSMEKLDAWRYFAMLSSPTTHIRNMVGNFAMGKMQKFKNRIAGGIQDIYYGVTGKKGERTATFFKANKKIREFCKNDIDNVKGRLGLGDNKYTNPKTQLQKNMRMFSDTKAGRFLENTVKKGLIDTTSNLLELEDVWGLKAAYVENMSQYLYANKIKLDSITDEQLAKARNYAIQQAKEATFHQDSALATLLNTFENKNLATKLFVGGIIPFKKTPFNVAKTALSYNPVSFLKTFTYDTAKLVNGQLSANQYIDNISKGLTGTGIALLGYALASMGIVRTTGDDDEDYEKDSGKQPYSLVIGDKSITLDWLSPTAVPFFTGAEMFNVLNKLDTDLPEGEQLDKRIERIAEMGDSFLSTLNPVSEMTMLEGITDALKSYSQGSAKWLEEIGANTIKTYVNQIVPSFQGKIAKKYDEYERSTSTTSKTVLGKTIESIKNQTISKIPGLRKTLPIKTDVWGNEIKTLGSDIKNPLLKNIVKFSYNYLSPSNIKDIRETQLDKEIKRLYESTGEKSVIPKTYIDKYFTYDNKEYRLNSNEYEAYKKTLGTNNYEILSNLIKSEDYKKLNDEEKAKVISQVYSYDKAVNKDAYAKIHNIKYTPSNTYNAQKKSIALGGKIEDYIMYNLQEFKADKDANGNAISGTAKKKVINYLNNSNMDYNQKLYLLGKDYALTNQEKSYLAYLIYDSDLTQEEKIDMYNDLTGFKVDKNGNVRW